MNDLVSIIMPSYNTSDYISESIQSVINQTYQNWELLIVDDCSTDDTGEVIKIFLSDSRIKYYKNEKNLGAAMSRNRALREANGKWIAFLDSDDLWLPKKLERQICFMEESNYHFSYTNYFEIDGNGNSRHIIVTGPKRITQAGFFNYCWPGCLTVMYDKEAIGLIQIIDIKKNNDYAMWLQISRISDCFLLNEGLALYRRGREHSISGDKLKTLIIWHYKLYRNVEGQNIPVSIFNTCRNLVFGLWKKIVYVQKEIG